jgi:hypothetical protein
MQAQQSSNRVQNSRDIQGSTKGAQVVEKVERRAHIPRDQQQPNQVLFNNDPSAGSPTETLLRLLLPLNDQV